MNTPNISIILLRHINTKHHFNPNRHCEPSLDGVAIQFSVLNSQFSTLNFHLSPFNFHLSPLNIHLSTLNSKFLLWYYSYLNASIGLVSLKIFFATELPIIHILECVEISLGVKFLPSIISQEKILR